MRRKGASDKPRPNMRWLNEVNLFVKLYPVMIIKAIGDKMKQIVFIKYVVIIKSEPFNY